MDQGGTDAQQQQSGGQWAAGIFWVALVFLLIVIGGYIQEWKWTGLPKQTLWDWLDLLIVPAVLAVGGYLFTRSENQRTLQSSNQQREVDREVAKEQAETDREIADQRRQDDTLQAYLDQIGQLLLDKERPLRQSKEDDEVQTLARARTLTVLPRLDRDRKARVVHFLYESDLIAKNRPIVAMGGADLSYANLSYANLREADLSRADLREANLRGANLREANLREANLQEADLQGADLTVAHLDGAHLEGANLRGAYTAPSQQPGMGPVLHQPEPEQRLTVPEAADALGVTPEAVRTRIQRGTLRSVRERGREFVLFGEWCSFRVWAPNAQEISLAGSFNDWADEQIWLEKEDQGYWSADVRRIRRDDTYKYVINHGGGSTGALTRTRGR